jgi:ferredoxin
MDLCLPKAIDMRIHKGNTLEGKYLSYLELNINANCESMPEQMMTFPYMANYVLCDGCMICVEECPTNAIEIIRSENNQIIKNVYPKELRLTNFRLSS